MQAIHAGRMPPPYEEIALPPGPPEHAVLLLGWSRGWNGGRIREDDAAVLACRSYGGWKEDLAFAPGDLLHADPGFLKARYPSDIPWTDLPVSGGPFRQLAAKRVMSADRITGEMRPVPRQVRDIMAQVRHLLVHLEDPEKRTDALANAAGILETAGLDLPVHGIGEDGKVRPVTPEELASSAGTSRAGERFAWNWKLNAGALFPPLLREAYRTRRPPGGNDGSRPTWEERALDALSADPLALQVLYLVSGRNPRPIPYGPGFAHAILRPIPILHGAGTRRLSGSREITVEWPGLAEETFLPGDAGTGRSPLQARLCGSCHKLEMARLLLPDEGRGARLGPAAAALLGLLPRACRDLGMAIRWLTPEGRNGTPDDIPAMDRWLTGTLRRVNRSASKCRASARHPSAPPG